MDDVARADAYGQERAAVLGLMALAIGFGLVFAVRTGAASDAQVAFGVPVYLLRLAITVLGALLLATGGGLLKPARVLTLANDEVTRAHRRAAVAAGFWAMLAIGVLGYLLSFGAAPLPSRLLARLVVDGGEATALLVFAGLEIVAHRRG